MSELSLADRVQVPSVTKEQELQEKFEIAIKYRKPFSPEIALYYINMKAKQSYGKIGPKLEASIRKSQTCFRDISLLENEEEYDLSQKWRFLCSSASGNLFVLSLRDYFEMIIPELQEQKFDEMAACLEETSEIINSIQENNGTQYTESL